MKTITEKAEAIFDRICEQYDKLTFDKDDRFFNLFHDTLYYQKQGAFETMGDVEYLEIHGETQKAENCLQEMGDALTYCKAVISLMNKYNKLPEPIYT